MILHGVFVRDNKDVKPKGTYFFITEKNAVQIRKKLRQLYGEGLLTLQCRNWFSKFRPDNFDIKNMLRFFRTIQYVACQKNQIDVFL